MVLNWYSEFSPYVNFISANFISANFITAIFQNFPEIFGAVQIVAANFNILPNKLNFCCGNYSRAETI